MLTRKPIIFKYKAKNKNGKLEVDTFVGVSKLDIYTFSEKICQRILREICNCCCARLFGV